MKKPKVCPLVIVTWVDSNQPRPSWEHLASYEKVQEPTLCASVGWLLQSDRKVKVLAQSLGGMEDASGGNAQSMGRVVIPTRAVLKIEPLAERRRGRAASRQR